MACASSSTFFHSSRAEQYASLASMVAIRWLMPEISASSIRKIRRVAGGHTPEVRKTRGGCFQPDCPKSGQVAQFSFGILYYQYPEHLSLTKFLLPIVPCEQVLTYLIGRQSGERVRGVVERKSEGFRQGDAISRGVEGMYHGEILSSFLLWGKGTNKMASIEMKVYISYMMYLMTVFVQWIEEKCIL